MVDTQEYLDKNYPLAERTKITELNISYENLTGSLKLEGFSNLTRLDCPDNQLTNLNLGDCSQLKVLRCDNNQLTKLTLPNLPQLEILSCSHNYLTQLDYSVLNPEKLTTLEINNNNLNNNVPSQDLTVFSRFINLEVLSIGNGNNGTEKIIQGIYNR